MKTEATVVVIDETGDEKQLTIPENALLIPSAPFYSRQKFCIVSYDGYDEIQLPTSSCHEIRDYTVGNNNEWNRRVDFTAREASNEGVLELG